MKSVIKNLASSQKQLMFEVVAVIVTAVGKFIFMDFLNWRFLFVATAIVFWTIYIVIRRRQNPEILHFWGFRTDNFKDVLYKVLPFGLVSVAVFLFVGYYQNSINITWHIIPILITYPIWGTIQQFLIVGLVAGNLKELKFKRLNSNGIVLITAVLFSVVHYPDYWLMIGTFVLALFYTIIYLKNKNLYVLGLFHGWLGALFYYTVVNRDPFLETFGRFLE